MTENQGPNADLAVRLAAYYERTSPGLPSRIAGFRRLAAGWECEVFAFDLASALEGTLKRTLEGSDEPSRPLVLRLYSGPEARSKADREFAIMRFVHGVGYPVPRVHLLELDQSPLGRPFVIMDRVDGERFSTSMRRASYPRKRQLITRFVQLLVDLHSVDWRAFAPDLDVRSERCLLGSFLDQMASILGRHDSLGAGPVLTWLRDHADEAGELRPALVHFDYHMENLIVRADDSIAVLDWTQGQIQDRRLDLGWTLLLTGMYDGWPLREAILGEYRRLAGWSVEGIEYFEVLAAARRLFSMLIILGGEGASLGLDPRAVSRIQSNLGHLAGVYTLLHSRTGVTVPAAERALAAWSGDR